MRDRRSGPVGWLLAPGGEAAPRGHGAGMAFVRVVLGLMWLYNVSWKVPNGFGKGSGSGSGLYKYLSYAVSRPVLPPYSWLVEHLALPHLAFFGWVTILVETALAVLLLSGTWVRAAALLGIAQSLAIGLSVAYAPNEWPWSYWLMVAAHVAVLVGASGRVLAVDAVRAGALPAARLQGVWAVVAVVVGVFSVVASAGDPLDSSGPGLRSSDLSVSLGTYNLVGGLVVALVGVALFLAARGSRAAAGGGAGLATLAALLLRAQIGFTDPWLGGNGTSVAVLLTLAVVGASSFLTPTGTTTTPTTTTGTAARPVTEGRP